MDAQDNGRDGGKEYARSPTVEDVIKVCRALNAEDARYVLIGGIAVIFYGLTRGTKDIDFLVDPAAENIAKIKRALSCLPDKAVQQIADDEVGKYCVVRVADEFVVDLMAKACGVTYEEARKDAEVFEIEGVEIPVAGRETLIKTKATPRPGDKMDVEFLKSLPDARE